MRSFIRDSWTNDLPKNVCYVFLYDKPEYIPIQEQFDGLSINATHEGRAVRFGEKLYRYYSYVINNPNLKNVKYVVKMDDDLVLCAAKFFNYLNTQNLTTKSYLGWFHNMNTWKSKVDVNHRSDEMFVLIGRDLVGQIASKEYCKEKTRSICDSLGHLYDTNYGGTSLGIWLETINNVNPIPMNHVFNHMNTNKELKPEDSLLFHATKTPIIAEEKYANCQRI